MLCTRLSCSEALASANFSIDIDDGDDGLEEEDEDDDCADAAAVEGGDGGSVPVPLQHESKLLRMQLFPQAVTYIYVSMSRTYDILYMN